MAKAAPCLMLRPVSSWRPSRYIPRWKKKLPEWSHTPIIVLLSVSAAGQTFGKERRHAKPGIDGAEDGVLGVDEEICLCRGGIEVGIRFHHVEWP